MTSDPLSIFIAGGGTGGHLYPGVALAREILRRRPDARIAFAGTAHGLEARAIPREGFPLEVIRSRGIKGKAIGDRLSAAALVPLSLADASRILSARRPHLVIGVGGYSSGPVVAMAWLRGIPTMLVEQNAVPGLTNRLLARIVRAAGVTFPSTAAFFGDKAFVSGNPVRPEFLEISTRSEAAAREQSPEGQPSAGARVLVFGGSQGAHAINVAMAAAAPELANVRPALRIAHQTGEREANLVRAAYESVGLEADVQPFFFDMGRRVAEADVIVCRAGATTIAEITAAGKPALLIPLPTATDDHQRKNAELLVSAGAAEMLSQAAATGHEMAARIGALAGDRARRLRLSAAARSLARPDAARVIVDRAFELAGADMLGRTRRVHFIGIGGSGMSGIAELLTNLGYGVSGSDEKHTPVTDRLAELGVRVHNGHAAEHIGSAEVVVVSSAVKPSNPEVMEAVRRHIPVIPRAEMLAELMRLRYAIAVAGAHGKTTTTSMIALMLERAGLDPTAVIGGRLSAFGSNARLGSGEWMVAEADESDRSFLKLFPTMAVITNIDHEHLENYGSFASLQQAFVEFANKVPFYGSVVCCADDPGLADVLPQIARRVTTYGLDMAADVTAADVRLGPMTVSATVRRRIPTTAGAPSAEVLGSLALGVPGRHNLLNALAAVAVGLELGLSFEQMASGLAEFRGAERRFEIRGEPSGILIVDDYGHHPTEIAAVLAAARTLNRRIVVAFQPHRYTRTHALKAAFGPAFLGADHVLLTDIYAAGESPIPGVTVDALAEEIRRSVTVPVDIVRDLRDVPQALARIAKPGDLVLTLGAGSIGTVPDQLVALLSEGRGAHVPRGAHA